MLDEQMDLLHFQHNGLNTLTVPAQVDYFSQIEAWLDEICDTMKVEPNVRNLLQIAADEIFTNICSYAYSEKKAENTISLTCSFHPTERILELTFSDHGIPFDPLTPQPLPNAPKSKGGGVGLLLIRKFADSLTYERREHQNLLTFMKKI